jgi:hypothetical protein
MSRQLFFGIAAAAALGAATLAAPTGASAQSWDIGIGSRHQDNQFTRPVQWPGGRQGIHRDGSEHNWGEPNRGGHYRGGGNWGGGNWGERRGDWHQRHAYNPGYGFHGGPRCAIRKVRYWDGWSWVIDRRQVCN